MRAQDEKSPTVQHPHAVRATTGLGRGQPRDLSQHAALASILSLASVNLLLRLVYESNFMLSVSTLETVHTRSGTLRGLRQPRGLEPRTPAGYRGRLCFINNRVKMPA